MKIRGEGCRKQHEVDSVDLLRIIDHFIQFAESKFREVGLVERVIDLRRNIVSATKEEKIVRAQREAEEIERELLKRKGSGEPDSDAAGGGEDY